MTILLGIAGIELVRVRVDCLKLISWKFSSFYWRLTAIPKKNFRGSCFRRTYRAMEIVVS